MALALRGLRQLAGLEVLDRYGLRDATERLVHRGTRGGMRAAGAASRSFSAASERLSRPARQAPRRPADLFDLTPDEEQRMLQAAFRGFAAAQVRPAAREADDAAETPGRILAQSAELGTLVLAIPEELGGVVGERSTVTSVLAAEALAHGDLGIAVACLAPAAVATAISLFGDADQQSTYLPAFAGETPPAAAFAVTEPRALFDPFELRTRARRDGDDLVLDGEKSLVPLARTAELFLVAVDLEDAGPAMVLIESSTAGVTVTPEPAMGIRPAATGRLHLDGVRVPATAVVGAGGRAVYAEAIQRARLGWCAVSVGTAKAVLDYVTPYVNERHAFGEPISHRQSVAFAVADIAVELEGMRLATYRAASLADRGKDIGRAVALARTLCAEKGMDIGSTGVQLLGGHGYVKEHPVERWYRDLRAVGALEGALLL
ncbi:MAG: acyl-CoA dehydrogenase family protein [Actinobacteria bacterium]|nr:acyl-CoA dehydrogenase family protein [Actinomycetota bacterium]